MTKRKLPRVTLKEIEKVHGEEWTEVMRKVFRGRESIDALDLIASKSNKLQADNKLCGMFDYLGSSRDNPRARLKFLPREIWREFHKMAYEQCYPIWPEEPSEEEVLEKLRKRLVEWLKGG